MERIFLAVIVSGLLLAATSVSLFVATGGGMTVAEVNVPQSPLPAHRSSPRFQYNTTLARDDGAR
jgi:hypothetical protein